MKEDILTKIPDVLHREPAVDIDAKEFEKVVTSRRSVRVYSGEKVPEEVIEKAIDHALLAPNSSNLQPWRFVWVKSEEKKNKLIEACLGQAAARTASDLIVILARTENWRDVREQMLKTLKENDAPKGALAYYEKIVPLAYDQGPLGIKGLIKRLVIFIRGFFKVTPRAPKSHADMRVWAHKSAALACENIMLSLRAQGYDSCPMEGFDEVRVLEVLGPELQEKGQEVCMVISAGKRAENGIYGPQIRMPKNQFVQLI